jgi:hypothetical protein
MLRNKVPIPFLVLRTESEQNIACLLFRQKEIPFCYAMTTYVSPSPLYPQDFSFCLVYCKHVAGTQR